MSITTRWHESQGSFEQQVQNFNERIHQSLFTSEEIDKISNAVHTEVLRLNDLSNEINRREENFEKKVFCYIPFSISEVMFNLLAFHLACNACVVGGAILGGLTLDTKKYDKNLKWIGLGLIILGGGLNTIADVYQAKLELEREESKELAKINKQGIEHAKLFQSFMEQLKEINQSETALLEAYKSHDRNRSVNQTIINLPVESLDERIIACLKNYTDLPAAYRREDVYSRIISQLIQKLPPDDPLRIGLDQLEPSITPEQAIVQQASSPLPIQYLPTVKRNRSSSSEAERNIWKAEGMSSDKQGNISPREAIDTEQAKIEYKRKMAIFQSQVIHRFGLRCIFPYIETPNGWKISYQDNLDNIQRMRHSSWVDLYHTNPKEEELLCTSSRDLVEAQGVSWDVELGSSSESKDNNPLDNQEREIPVFANNQQPTESHSLVGDELV